MKRIDSPHCISCKLHVPETNQHALIECEKHKSIRDEYIIKIHEITRSQQITLPMLLWRIHGIFYMINKCSYGILQDNISMKL